MFLNFNTQRDLNSLFFKFVLFRKRKKIPTIGQDYSPNFNMKKGCRVSYKGFISLDPKALSTSSAARLVAFLKLECDASWWCQTCRCTLKQAGKKTVLFYKRKYFQFFLIDSTASLKCGLDFACHKSTIESWQN
jgi:hypothetical protein